MVRRAEAREERGAPLALRLGRLDAPIGVQLGREPPEGSSDLRGGRPARETELRQRTRALVRAHRRLLRRLLPPAASGSEALGAGPARVAACVAAPRAAVEEVAGAERPVPAAEGGRRPRGVEDDARLL